MAKTRREFTLEFKREAVALLESSSRPQMQIAAELGIQPSMLRQWRATLNGATLRSRSGAPPALIPARPIASPSDQAAEIARLRRELDRTRMERDVGWSMRDHMRTELTTAALMMAAQRQRPRPGLVCHSDRGSQYAAEAYRKQLSGMNAIPSTSRTACCYDNAPMESFFHTLKSLPPRRRGSNSSTSDDGGPGDEARRDPSSYIEGYDNRQRIHSALGYITPEQTEWRAS